jgi:hypothetical protein
MQKIPFRKRILFYLALLPISLGASYFSAMLIILISGDRYTGLSFSVILALPITHYIFGRFFLKTRLIIKILVPLIITLASFGVLLLIWSLHLEGTHIFDMYGYVDLIILMFVIFVVLWEITYQILIRCLNKKSPQI